MTTAEAMTPAIKRLESPKKAQIRLVAYRVMNELGFDAASYSEIARQSGYGRPLVQMYFPKKDQFIIDMNEDFIDRIFEMLQSQGKLSCGAYEKTLRIAQVYFSLLLRDEQAVRLTREILGKRSILRGVFGLYQMKVITMGFDAEPEDINTAMLKALGGVEELVMSEIDHGMRLDANDIACQLLAALKVFLVDSPYGQAYAEMSQCLLPREEVRDVVDVVAEEILSQSDVEIVEIRPLVRSIA